MSTVFYFLYTYFRAYIKDPRSERGRKRLFQTPGPIRCKTQGLPKQSSIMGFFAWVFCYAYLKLCYVCMGWDGREPSYRCILYTEGFEFIACMHVYPGKHGCTQYNGKDIIFVGCSFCMSLRGYHNCKFFVRITIFMTRIVIPHVVLSLNTQHPRCLRIELIGLST